MKRPAEKWTVGVKGLARVEMDVEATSERSARKGRQGKGNGRKVKKKIKNRKTR